MKFKVLLALCCVVLIPLAARAEEMSRNTFAAPNAELRGLAQEPLKTIKGQFVRYRSDAYSLAMLDSDKSLLVRAPTGARQLSGFSVEEIFVHLAADAKSDAKSLFRQFLSSLAFGTEIATEPETSCPDGTGTHGMGNPFTVLCDPYLAKLAALDDPFGPADDPHFRVIAAVNRGDLLTPVGAASPPDCGEFRLVVSADPDWLKAKFPDIAVLLINVEPSLPDLSPADRPGEQCVFVQRFWGNLSRLQTPDEIADALHRFYFDGGSYAADGSLVDGAACPAGCYAVGPVISASNMTARPQGRPGQVRLNSKTGKGLWVLREFKFDAAARLLPVPLANTPDPMAMQQCELDDAACIRDREAMRDAILKTAPSLVSDRFAGLTFRSPPWSYTNQQAASTLSGADLPSNPYVAKMDKRVMAAFDLLAAKMAGSDKPDAKKRKVINRFTLLSCAGCHALANKWSSILGFEDVERWPNSNGFTHIELETNTDQTVKISAALRCVLLPRRAAIMVKVMAAEQPPAIRTPAC